MTIWWLFGVSYPFTVPQSPCLMSKTLFPMPLWTQIIELSTKLTNVSQLQFGAGENAGLEENLAAAQQQMQVMQQVIVTFTITTIHTITNITNIISTIIIITITTTTNTIR